MFLSLVKLSTVADELLVDYKEKQEIQVFVRHLSNLICSNDKICHCPVNRWWITLEAAVEVSFRWKTQVVRKLYKLARLPDFSGHFAIWDPQNINSVSLHNSEIVKFEISPNFTWLPTTAMDRVRVR